MPNGPIYVIEAGAYVGTDPDKRNYAYANLMKPNNGVGGAVSAGEAKATTWETNMTHPGTEIFGYTPEGPMGGGPF